jgi:hypothetical protein
MGFELSFIEWQTRDGDWKRADLDHGHCDLGPIALPCRVRAPGHAAALASKDDDDVVLEPDALLTLDANGLRACLTSIEPYDVAITDHENEAMFRPEFRRAVAWRWLSDNRWGICVSTELIDEASGDSNEIEVAIHWRDSHSAMLIARLEAGARETWQVPCETIVAALPLDVTITAPHDERAGTLAVRLSSVSSDVDDGRFERLQWGSVSYRPPNSVLLDRTVPVGSNTLHFEAVPTGVRLSLAACDNGNASYGRTVFVHDGSPRTLELRPAFELVGRIVSDADESPLAAAGIGWHFGEGRELAWGWQAWDPHQTLERGGSFRLRGPQAPLSVAGAPLDPPSALTVRVDVPGFEHFERRFETAGARRFDCGELRLKPLTPQVVLAPGHGLTRQSIRWTGLRTSTPANVLWLVENGVLESDGSMSVHLREDEASVAEHRTFATSQLPDGAWAATPWPEAPSHWINLAVHFDDRDEDWLFERQSDGRYAAVPRREMDLVLECGASLPSDARWRVGWKWRDQWGGLANAPSAIGTTWRLHVSFPADGATLWWSNTWMPPANSGANGGIGGTIPFDAITEKIVLR